MRTFKKTGLKNQKKLFELFPMLGSDNWDESSELTRLPISIWDYWLHEKGDQDVLKNISVNESHEYSLRFSKLHHLISQNLEIFLADYKKSKLLFREVADLKSLPLRLDPEYAKKSFVILMPEIEAILQSAYDYTEILYYKDESKMKGFFDWVKQCNLKFIKS